LNYRKTLNILTYFGIFIILFIGGCSLSYSNPLNKIEPSIENPIDFSWGNNLDDPQPHLDIYARLRFEELPSVKKTVVLRVSLQSTIKIDSSIMIYLDGNNSTFDTEPQKIEWPGPIDKGKVFEAEFRIGVREVGRHYLHVMLVRGGELISDYMLSFVIDDRDQIKHLSRFSSNLELRPNHIPVELLKDEIVMSYGRHSLEKRRENEGFQTTFRIAPIPELGDTVNVNLALVATRDYPNGVQLQLTATSNLEVLNLPPNWTGKILKNDIYETEIKVLFKTPGESYLQIVGTANYFNTQSNGLDYWGNYYGIYFQISEDGNLSYVGRQDKHSSSDPQKSSVDVAAAMGEKHEVPYQRNYKFQPEIQVLGPTELKKLTGDK